MSDDNTRRFHRLRSAFGTTRQLAGTWAQAKTQRLQEQLDAPESWIEGGGTSDRDRWQDRRATRDQLKEYHNIRVDGGVIATLLEARSLMVFGPGGQFTSEDDDVAAWLNDTWNDRDIQLVDIGTDTYFYGYSLGEIRETNGGDFGEITLIQPWTTVPELNRQGEIDEWEQTIKTDAGTSTQTFDPDDVLHFNVMKASGRDPVGMSMLGRAMDEAGAYRENQQAIQNAVQLQGFPKFHVSLGSDDGPVIDDNELRRARPQFDNIHELTKWVTGNDVEIDIVEAENFDFEGITEHDLSKLAIAFMLPIELTQIAGGDGLGTGFPAKLRRQLFMLGARAHQRLLGDHLVQQVGRPLLQNYAPDDLVGDGEDINLEFVFNDPLTDMDELNKQVGAIGSDMTVDERRDLFDLPPLDDESLGDDFEPPGRADNTPAPDAEGDGFSGDQRLAEQQFGEDETVSAQVLGWIAEFAEDDGTIDEPISEILTWIDEAADTPNEAISRVQSAVTVFANSQGVRFGEATEQPVENLLQYLQRQRNLQGDGADAEQLVAEIETYRDGFDAIVWGELDHDLAQPVFGNDDDVPANVRNRLSDAANAVAWSDTEGAPPGNLRDFFVRKLSQPQGWSINSLVSGLREEFGTFDGPDHRENIARTKSAALLSEAKRRAFEDLEDGVDGDLLYFWDGPSDDTTTDACSELKNLTNPEHGGQPRPRDEFDQLQNSVRNEYFPEFESGGDAIHWQERHAVEAVLPDQADVNPAGVGGMATGAGDD